MANDLIGHLRGIDRAAQVIQEQRFINQNFGAITLFIGQTK
jgi:hypothetical protein